MLICVKLKEQAKKRSLLVCSKNRSSVLAASNVLVSSSPSFSSSSFSDSSAPKGLALVSPKVEVTLGDAKLVLPVAADPNPPPIPPKPVLLGAAEKGLADLKTDDVDAPRVPNGDFSVPANPPNADPAKAEPEVVFSLLVGASADNGDLAPASLANGESAAALAKALVEKS